MCKALNALSPTPGTSARVGRDERDEGWELARLTHAPARVLSRARDTRKLESQTPNLCTLAHRGGGGLKRRNGIGKKIRTHGPLKTLPTTNNSNFAAARLTSSTQGTGVLLSYCLSSPVQFALSLDCPYEITAEPPPARKRSLNRGRILRHALF